MALGSSNEGEPKGYIAPQRNNTPHVFLPAISALSHYQPKREVDLSTHRAVSNVLVISPINYWLISTSDVRKCVKLRRLIGMIAAEQNMVETRVV